tara:strand:+ start:12532 stop:12870 length:339 start_codon:yes stop_codon:yes gene_type:complete
MDNAYDYIEFSKGDLIVDRAYKEIGILVKRSRVINPVTEFKHGDNWVEKTFSWGWEVLWIKKKENSGNIGPFKNLDRVLTESGMKDSIFAGTLEHFRAGSTHGIDLDTYMQR